MKKNYSTENFMNENYRDWFYRNWIGTHKIILAEIFKIIAEQNTLVLGSVGPGHQPYVLVVHLQLAEEASTHGTGNTTNCFNNLNNI